MRRTVEGFLERARARLSPCMYTDPSASVSRSGHFINHYTLAVVPTRQGAKPFDDSARIMHHTILTQSLCAAQSTPQEASSL